MTHSLIGLIVGVIVGLTGAGGALISIPLFLNLLDASLKEATVLSLSAVMLGSAVSLFGLYKRIDKEIVIYFVLFGAIGNVISIFVKNFIPDIAIVILLSCIGVYSIWGVLSEKSKPEADEEAEDIKNKYNIYKLASTGLFLGVITTLTGLGGGVLLVPILIKVFGKNYIEALPTSLATILLISIISFLLQLETGLSLITIFELGLIGAGTLIASFVLRAILRKMKPETIDVIRKSVFILVILYAIGTIVIKSL